MPQTQPGTPTDRSTLRAASVRRGVDGLRAGFRGPEARDRLLTAGTALAVLLVARFALGLVALIGSAVGFSVTSFPSGFVSTPVGQFLGSFVLYPFPFYLASFVVLVAVRPLTPRSDLRTVVRHALVAGGVGTVALAVVGIVPGVVLSLSGGTWANLALYLTTIPLAAGIVDTALLVAGAVSARLWLGGGDGDDAWSSAARDDRHTSEDAVEGDSDDATDAGDVDAPPSSHRTNGDGPPAARSHDRPADRHVEPVVPSAPTPVADDWSRFAPPGSSHEGER